MHPDGEVRATERRRAMNTRSWLYAIARLMGDTSAIRRATVGAVGDSRREMGEEKDLQDDEDYCHVHGEASGP